jgi:predicted signal transduction protein with EAL and GGDEF domain
LAVPGDVTVAQAAVQIAGLIWLAVGLPVGGMVVLTRGAIRVMEWHLDRQDVRECASEEQAR